MPVDLSRLSDAERLMLRLLAEGHTAKSIAAMTDLSVNAVNERLREARRKTGVGSSRELSRLLRDRPLENRDDEIGVAPPPVPAASPAAPIRPTAGGTPKGMIAMASFVLVGTFAVWFLSTVAPSVPARPKVIAVQPAPGARLAAGPVTLSVTFDRAMRADSYSFVTVDAGTYPDCAAKPRQSADGRTFLLDCTAAPGQSYAVGINGGRFWNFVDAQTGVPAEPALLRFVTR